MVAEKNLIIINKVLTFALEKVLLRSEGPGSTKAVYVAQAGLFLLFMVISELRSGDLYVIAFLNMLENVIEELLLCKGPMTSLFGSDRNCFVLLVEHE